MKTCGTRRHREGFTLVEVMVVVAVVGMLATIAIPDFLKARAKAQAKVCLANQRMMSAAKDMAAMDNRWGANVSYGTLGGAYQQTLASYFAGVFTKNGFDAQHPWTLMSME